MAGCSTTPEQMAGCSTTPEHVYYIPTDETTLIRFAQRIFKDGNIRFRTGVRCPEPDCKEEPFASNDILYLHIMAHQNIYFVCPFCPSGFYREVYLVAHYEEEHQRTNKVQEYMGNLIDTRKVLRKKMRDMSGNMSRGAPTLSSYKEHAFLVVVCQFPQTVRYIDDDEITHSLTKCSEDPLFTGEVICPLIVSDAETCFRTFGSCKELLLHTAEHFAYKVVCKHCFLVYKNKDDGLYHAENSHNQCMVCGNSFENSRLLKEHETKVYGFISHYLLRLDPIDVTCKLYLPNLAFHHSNLEETEYHEAVEFGEHQCLNPAQELHKYLNTANHLDDGTLRMKECFRDTVLIYSESQKCAFEDCPYTYMTCREWTVHVLMTHSNITNYTYACSCHHCYQPFADKEFLKAHMASQHRFTPYCTNCLLSFDNHLNRVIHAFSSGHLRKSD